MTNTDNNKIRALALKVLKEEMLLLEQETDTAKLKVGDSYREPGEQDVRYEIDNIAGDQYSINVIENGKYVRTKTAKIYNIDTFIEDGIYEIIKNSSSTTKKEEDPADTSTEPQSTDTPGADTQDTEEDEPKEKGATTWEKVKYVLGKLGAYKVDGKILGKKKIRKESEDKIKAILDKKSNELIKDVDSKIKESNPKFPNNVKGDDFLSSVLSIAACYDSIVESAKKDGEDRLPVDAANEIINDLRDYVKKLLDVDLSASYSTLDENKEEVEVDEDAAADARAKLKADRAARVAGGNDQEYKSTKIDTLKSNKLPLKLLGVGTAFGAFSWIVNTDWFEKMYGPLKPENYTKLVPEESKEIYSIKEGDGAYKFLSSTTGIDLDANQDPQKLVDAFKQIGGGDANKGVELFCQKGGVMMRPEDAEKGLKAFIKNPDQYKNLGQFFSGQASGTGKIVPTDTTLYGTISGKQMIATVIKMIPKIFATQGTKASAAYAIAKGLGPVLGPIGVGLVAAGAIVKLMRMKGLKQSRAATLNALYQSLRNIPGGEIVKPEGPVDQSIKIQPIEAPAGTTAATVEKERTSSVDSLTSAEPSGAKGTSEPGKADKDADSTKEPVAPSTPADSKKPSKDAETTTAAEEKPDTEKEKGDSTKDTSEDGDTLYKILKNTFKYVVDNKTTLSSKSDVPASKKETEVGKSKLTDKQKETVFKTLKDASDKRKESVLKRMYNKGVDIDSTADFLIKSGLLTKEKADEIINNIKTSSEKKIAEGRYIRNNNVIKYASKKLSYKKVQAFEKLMRKVELIRDKVKAIEGVKDPELGSIIRKFDSSPIMSLNFREAFNVNLEDTDEVDSLITFIDDMFSTIYTKSYEKSNLVDKAATVLGGPIAEAFEKACIKKGIYETYLKSTKYRTGIKRHIIVFLVNAFRLFKYLDEKLKSKK